MKTAFRENLSSGNRPTNLFGGTEPSNFHRGKDVPVGGEVNVVSVSFHSYSYEIHLKKKKIKILSALIIFKMMYVVQ